MSAQHVPGDGRRPGLRVVAGTGPSTGSGTPADVPWADRDGRAGQSPDRRTPPGRPTAGHPTHGHPAAGHPTPDRPAPGEPTPGRPAAGRRSPRGDGTAPQALARTTAPAPARPALPLSMRTRDVEDPSRATLLLLAEHFHRGVGHFSRTVGIDGAASVADMCRAVLTSFRWPGVQDRDDATTVQWTLWTSRGGRVLIYGPGKVSPDTTVADALGADGAGVLQVREADPAGEGAGPDTTGPAATADTTAGPPARYEIYINVTGAVVRDASTPDAVCLGGEFVPDLSTDAVTGRWDVDREYVDSLTDIIGSLHPLGIPAAPDIAAVNVALAGEARCADVMQTVRPEVRELLEGHGLMEFVPLLQALDLQRPAQVSEHIRSVLADVPVETTAAGRAAAWSRIMALSTLCEQEIVDEVSESVMVGLGVTRADAGLPVTEGRQSGDPLDSAEIRALSAGTGRLLAVCGADGWPGGGAPGGASALVPRRSVVDRLEIYRYLLQNRGR
ncbi:hypothetical protein V5T12_10025 [Corynebacterium bovis]|uniref:hypothetical protein n=2 Tax=Corynebacterium bovis TaxID=36808 RepID=UPI0030805182